MCQNLSFIQHFAFHPGPSTGHLHQLPTIAAIIIERHNIHYAVFFVQLPDAIFKDLAALRAGQFISSRYQYGKRGTDRARRRVMSGKAMNAGRKGGGGEGENSVRLPAMRPVLIGSRRTE